jgi:IS5 family transposase
VHTVIGTASNVADVTQAHPFLRGDETRIERKTGLERLASRPFGSPNSLRKRIDQRFRSAMQGRRFPVVRDISE